MYIPVLQLGFFQAASRDIPQLLGKGEQSKIEKIEFNGLLLSLVVGVLAVVLYLGIFFFQYSSLSNISKICWGLFTLLILTQPVTQFFQMLYSANGLFKNISIIKLVNSVVFFALLSLVYLWGYIGQLLSLILASIFLVVLMWYHKRVKINFKWLSLNLIKTTMQDGLPILLSTLALNVFYTIDRIFIISFYGIEEYGYYAIGVAFFQVSLFIPDSIRQVAYRFFNIEYGKNSKGKKLNSGFWLSFIVVSIIMSLISVVSYNVTPFFIEWLIPKYIKSIEIVKVFSLAMSFIGPGLILSNAIYTIHKQKFVLLIYLISLLIFSIIAYYFILNDLEIYYIAISMLIAHAFSWSAMLLYIFKQKEYQILVSQRIKIIVLLIVLLLTTAFVTVGFEMAIDSSLNIVVTLLGVITIGLIGKDLFRSFGMLAN